MYAMCYSTVLLCMPAAVALVCLLTSHLPFAVMLTFTRSRVCLVMHFVVEATANR